MKRLNQVFESIFDQDDSDDVLYSTQIEKIFQPTTTVCTVRDNVLDIDCEGRLTITHRTWSLIHDMNPHIDTITSNTGICLVGVDMKYLKEIRSGLYIKATSCFNIPAKIRLIGSTAIHLSDVVMKSPELVTPSLYIEELTSADKMVLHYPKIPLPLESVRIDKSEYDLVITSQHFTDVKLTKYGEGIPKDDSLWSKLLQEMDKNRFRKADVRKIIRKVDSNGKLMQFDPAEYFKLDKCKHLENIEVRYPRISMKFSRKSSRTNYNCAGGWYLSLE